MRFAEIKAALKKGLNGSPQEFIDLIETHAFPLKNHPSFTINLCHKVWTKAFHDPCWTQVVHKMGEVGLRTSNPFMWVKRSLESGKWDLACVTHQFANYSTDQDKNKNMATLWLALYAKRSESSFLLSALISTPVDLSYTFERVPWTKDFHVGISSSRIEGHTLACNLMREAPLTLVYEIISRNNYQPTSKEWGALVSSSRISKHPVVPFNDLLSLLVLDNNNGEFALQSMIAENTNRWALTSIPDDAIEQITHSNPHFKHLPDVAQHLQSQKVKQNIEKHISALHGLSTTKRKI